MEGLVTTRRAAEIAGISESFLYHNHPHIPACFRAGRALRWDVTELLAWMKAQANGNGVTGSNGTGDHDD